jgi:hypothetical protein
MSVAGIVQDIPQGLKPRRLRPCFGTAKAVPLQNTDERELMA